MPTPKIKLSTDAVLMLRLRQSLGDISCYILEVDKDEIVDFALDEREAKFKCAMAKLLFNLNCKYFKITKNQLNSLKYATQDILLDLISKESVIIELK